MVGLEGLPVNLVKLPDDITDDQAILMSDIFPTGWFAADLADIEGGHTVAVFGCGPVGQFAIASAQVMGARVIAVDRPVERLGGRRPVQGRPAVGRRRLSAERPGVPDRQGDEQESHHQDGQLQPPPLLRDAGRPGALRRHRPVKILTQVEPMRGAIDAYEAFDKREPGWIKVELKPKAA